MMPDKTDSINEGSGGISSVNEEKKHDTEIDPNQCFFLFFSCPNGGGKAT